MEMEAEDGAREERPGPSRGGSDGCIYCPCKVCKSTWDFLIHEDKINKYAANQLLGHVGAASGAAQTAALQGLAGAKDFLADAVTKGV